MLEFVVFFGKFSRFLLGGEGPNAFFFEPNLGQNLNPRQLWYQCNIIHCMEIDFTELVEKEADYLYRYAKRHFPSEDVAEDLVQEVFLAALQSADRFKGESTLRTWLVSILRHKIIDRIRRNSREILPYESEEAEKYLDTYFTKKGHWREEKGPRPFSQNPEVSFSEKQFMEVLQDCLSKLPARLRHVFLLREMDGVEPEVICNELGLTPTNLRVMLHRGRILLRDCVGTKWLSK